jgi:5-methylcytosine-specific restriction endonuclease McrA
MRRCLGCAHPARPGQSRCAACCASVQRRRNADRALNAATVAGASVCAICGGLPTPRDPLTADHVRPVSGGGTSDPTNLRAVHRSCNSRKRDR